MNLSPDWVPLFSERGWPAVHWSEVGAGNAPDTELMRWAREQQFVVVTQDLDFPQILFATREAGPSVIVLRMDNEFDEAGRAHVCAAIGMAQPELLAGALLTVSERRVRLRRLPIQTWKEK